MSKEESAAVLDYLERMNRPYSINDICQNLQKEFAKTVVQKALTQLVTENKIKEKVYNKQKIYSIIQKSAQESDDVLKAMQECELEILQKTEFLKKLEQELKSLECELKRYSCTLTLKEAQDRKCELQKSVQKLENKLSELSQNTISIPPVDRNEVEKGFNAAVKAYKSRKRICTDILDSILENYPKKRSVLVEEIGLELDDESNTPLVSK